MVSKQVKGLAAIALVALVAMLSLGLVSIPAAQAATSTTVVVTENDVAWQEEDSPPTKNWVIYTRPTAPGIAQFISGPATPPLGVGSLELSTNSGSDKVYAFNFDYVGTRLADIDAMGYSTYRSTGSLQQVTALNIVVDFNGPDVDGGFTTLVFEPVYNTDQGPVVSGQWQTWDAFNGGNGRWWSSRDIPGVCAFTCYASWSAILANNPDATILGGFGVNQGSGNAGLVAAVDALTIGVSGNTTVYNFEPMTKDLCKDGGWKTMTRADGSAFKNQGDCVSYVNTGK
jgi:hypothetical protein